MDNEKIQQWLFQELCTLLESLSIQYGTPIGKLIGQLASVSKKVQEETFIMLWNEKDMSMRQIAELLEIPHSNSNALYMRLRLELTRSRKKPGKSLDRRIYNTKEDILIKEEKKRLKEKERMDKWVKKQETRFQQRITEKEVKDILKQKRLEKILELRSVGKTYEEIGKSLEDKISKERVRQILEKSGNSLSGRKSISQVASFLNVNSKILRFSVVELGLGVKSGKKRRGDVIVLSEDEIEILKQYPKISTQIQGFEMRVCKHPKCSKSFKYSLRGFRRGSDFCSRKCQVDFRKISQRKEFLKKVHSKFNSDTKKLKKEIACLVIDPEGEFIMGGRDAEKISGVTATYLKRLLYLKIIPEDFIKTDGRMARGVLVSFYPKKVLEIIKRHMVAKKLKQKST